MQEVVVVGALRTPIGRFNGMFKDIDAITLGSRVISGLLAHTGLKGEDIEAVIMGSVLQAGLGQNPARQMAIQAGLPFTSVAMTVNEVCGSGLKAIQLGMQAIQLAEHQIVIVGGSESMSGAPYLLKNARSGAKYQNLKTEDVIFRDGLSDAFSGETMGLTAERVADVYHISREAQDEFAFASQKKAAVAQEQGYFKAEIVGVPVNDMIMTEDEGIRKDVSLEKLASLRPAFKEGGCVTAGNSSTINDGAAALILMSKAEAERRHLPILATLKGVAEVGVDPDLMGYAPYDAIQALEKKLQISRNDVDLFELNEAFASQSVAVIRDLGLDEARVNINGGAIALGHPIGASGARIVVTLLHELIREQKKTGIASLCIGGGLGLALYLERSVV